MFGFKNPADAASPYYSQIPGATSPYFDPYINAGKNAIPGLEGQYKGLMGDPGGMMNKFGESYKESPGMKFAIQQALQASGNAAAAGGMAGSPQHSQQNMQLANDIASQDYNNWMQNALGLYGQGLTGSQGLAGMGLNAGKSQADMIAQALAAQANNAYEGQAAENENTNSWFNKAGQLAGAGAGFAVGGPFGAYLGAQAFS
jgi:hypothetical protein